MKKLLCIVFVFAILVSTVHAAGGYDLTQAVTDAKSKLEIPTECTEFSSSVQGMTGITVYCLAWTTPDDADDYKSVEVQMSDRGDILSFYFYDRGSERKTGISDFSRDELVEKAKAWADRVNPSWSTQIDAKSAEVYTSVYDSDVSVSFMRKIGEHEVYGNYFSVNVDKFTGKVINAYSNWTYAQSELTNAAMPEADAEDKFAESLGMELVYMKKHDAKTAVLVYMPKKSGLWIDAQTGEPVAPKDSYGSVTNDSMSSVKEDMVESAGAAGNREQLTEIEIQEISQMESLITEDEVAAIIKSLENTPFKDATVSSVFYEVYKEKDSKDTYTVTATLEDAEGKRIGRVRLDAENGTLIALDTYSHSNKKDDALDPMVMKKSAESFLQKYAADIKDKVKIFNETENSSYLYERDVNNIRFSENFVRISLDPYTGEIISYQRSFSNDIAFDDPSGVIDETAATDALFEKNPLKAFYADLSGKAVSDDFRLVYMLSGANTIIDARTGKLLKTDLTEYVGEEDKVMPKDLEGHWAKDMVLALIENGVITLSPAEASFNPNGTLTQSEALELVCALTGMYLPKPMDVSALYTRVINRDILDAEEKNPEMLVTRQEAVKYIIRALGYRDVAELSEIYNCRFTDQSNISTGYEGYVALAKGLGVVSGDGNGAFNPQNTVTRAEFAAMMYKYLTR